MGLSNEQEEEQSQVHGGNLEQIWQEDRLFPLYTLFPTISYAIVERLWQKNACYILRHDQW